MDNTIIEISKDDKRYIKRICNNNALQNSEKINILKKYLDKTEEEIKEIINSLGYILNQSHFSAAKRHILKKKKRYIISSAQAASPVHLSFLNNIKKYAEFIDAEIGIIATRYKNPTSLFKEEGDVWDTNVLPYLTASRQYLHKNVLLLADLKIQATAPNPTNGLELFGDSASCIVGSPRIEMKSVPVLPNQNQKFLWSTGTVTVPNFTDSVAGGKAEEHHTYGFLVVEIEDSEIVHIRNVSASSKGDFNDLIYRVQDEQIIREDVDCLVWGDIHFAKKDQKVIDAFRKLCENLHISTSILHDTWDSESINIHNLKNPVVKHQLMMSGKDDLNKEFKQMYSELNWFEKNMKETFIVASNHDDMLDRAMYLGDWRDNLKNSKIFIKFLDLTLSGKATNGIIPYYINKKYKKIKALGLNDSYIKYGVELALHGHKGANGAKGSIHHFSRLSNKTIIGHSHSPGIRWGCYQVGVACKLDHDYNKGLSGWAYAGTTLNKYGKRQMIILNKNSLTYTTLWK